MPIKTINKSNEWKKFIEHFFEQQVPARTILLRDGEISQKAYYVKEGSTRIWPGESES